MNKFICDGCGKEYPIEDIGDEVNNDNLAGIVMCKSCLKTPHVSGYDPISPGDKSGSFILYFTEHYYKKNDVLDSGNGLLKVTKVYKFNLWRRILHFFGIKFKMFNAVKVITNE